MTDFGIARITDSSKTKTGLVLGTPSFMSPEQIAGKKVDGRSDLYSLGVMLFQMLTGVLPFRGDSMAELMYKIANEEAPDIRIVRQDLPERLAQVVARVAGQEARDRATRTATQFAADLRAVDRRARRAGGRQPRPRQPPGAAAPRRQDGGVPAGRDPTHDHGTVRRLGARRASSDRASIGRARL